MRLQLQPSWAKHTPLYSCLSPFSTCAARGLRQPRTSPHHCSPRLAASSEKPVLTLQLSVRLLCLELWAFVLRQSLHQAALCWPQAGLSLHLHQLSAPNFVS